MNTPLLLVAPEAAANVLLPPEADKLTVVLGDKLLYASSAVNVRVVVLVPLAVTALGLATSVEVDAAAGPEIKVIVVDTVMPHAICANTKKSAMFRN